MKSTVYINFNLFMTSDSIHKNTELIFLIEAVILISISENCSKLQKSEIDNL